MLQLDIRSREAEVGHQRGGGRCLGAHVGVHSLVAARRLATSNGGRVIAFEPATDSATKLRAAADRNGLVLEVVQAALGAEPGEATLCADGNYDLHDAGVRSQFASGPPVERVAVMAFDDWAHERQIDRVDVVQIDVEGAEPLVLAGMKRTLSTRRPRAILIETKPYSLDRAGTNEADIPSALAALGYQDQGVDLDRNRLFRPHG